jgi:excisionase family DNA binding protein
MITDDLYSVKDAAPLLRLSTVTLRRMIHNGAIGYKRIGKLYRFTPAHIQNYLNSVDVLPAQKAQGGN